MNTTRPWARLGHLALMVLVLMLMTGSVGATFVFTTRTEAQARAAIDSTRARALAESDEYKALTADIETHTARIAAFMEDAYVLRRAGMPTKAGEKDKLLLTAQLEKDAVVAHRAALRSTVPPSVETSTEAMHWVHLAVAVVLELVSVAACVLLHTAGASETAVSTARITVPSGGSGGNVVPIGATCCQPRRSRAGQPSVGPSLGERCAEARRLIESGQIDPSQEALARALRISQRPATRLLKELCGEGVIRWVGNRYMLCLSATRVAV